MAKRKRRGTKHPARENVRWPFYEPDAKEEHPGHVSMPTPVPDHDPTLPYAAEGKQRVRGMAIIRRGDGTVEETGIETVVIGGSPVVGGWPSEGQPDAQDPSRPRVVQIEVPKEGD